MFINPLDNTITGFPCEIKRATVLSANPGFYETPDDVLIDEVELPILIAHSLSFSVRATHRGVDLEMTLPTLVDTFYFGCALTDAYALLLSSVSKYKIEANDSLELVLFATLERKGYTSLPDVASFIPVDDWVYLESDAARKHLQLVNSSSRFELEPTGATPINHKFEPFRLLSTADDLELSSQSKVKKAMNEALLEKHNITTPSNLGVKYRTQNILEAT